MWDDSDDDWDENEDEAFRKRDESIYKHPLYLKSMEIFALTNALVGSLDEARRELYGSLMQESASNLAVKFSGAESVDDYILKMENAVIMKVHARSLHTITYQLALQETHAEEHLQLLRDAINEFKVLFVKWVKGFDPKEKYKDGWGLFED